MSYFESSYPTIKVEITEENPVECPHCYNNLSFYAIYKRNKKKTFEGFSAECIICSNYYFYYNKKYLLDQIKKDSQN